MDTENFHTVFMETLLKLKAFWFSIAACCIGLLLIGYGLITSMGKYSASDGVVFESSKTASNSAAVTTGENVVDVSGAVVKPGVYHLPNGSRIENAITISGGLSETADRDWVNKKLNLAAKVTDGMKIYVPRIGEGAIRDTGDKGVTGGVVAGASTTNSDSLININDASSEQLDNLPGVGPVTAEKIIGGRPYSSIDELLSKKIVTKSVFEKIKGQVTAP